MPTKDTREKADRTAASLERSMDDRVIHRASDPRAGSSGEAARPRRLGLQGRISLPEAVARLSRLVPRTTPKPRAEPDVEYEQAAREVFRAAVIAGSTEPLVPAIRTPRAPRQPPTRSAAGVEEPADGRDERSRAGTTSRLGSEVSNPKGAHTVAPRGGLDDVAMAISSVTTAMPPGTGVAPERRPIRPIRAALRTWDSAPKAPNEALPAEPSATEGDDVVPPPGERAPALNPSEAEAERPSGKSVSPHRRQRGDTAPERLLRAPETVGRVADDFFGEIIRQVDRDH